jgi:hypothetical protein
MVYLYSTACVTFRMTGKMCVVVVERMSRDLIFLIKQSTISLIMNT